MTKKNTGVQTIIKLLTNEKIERLERIEGNVYKAPKGRYYCSSKKMKIRFGVNFFAKQEKIMTK